MVFDRDAGAPVAVRAAQPLNECAFVQGHDGPAAECAAGTMRGDHLSGEVALGPHRVAWDLRCEGGQAPLLLLPRTMYETRFPRAKSIASRPQLRFSGKLVVDGRHVQVDNWIGSGNHNWGSRHTDEYAYAQVCGFDGFAESFVETITASVNVGPLRTPKSTLMVLRHRGRDHVLNDPLRGAMAFARFDLEGYRFSLARGDIAVEGQITPRRSDLVVVPYLNPPGGVKHCINTKIAEARLSVRVGHQRDELVAPHGAVFEMILRGNSHGLPLAFS